jgi:hypothetical protein
LHDEKEDFEEYSLNLEYVKLGFPILNNYLAEKCRPCPWATVVLEYMNTVIHTNEKKQYTYQFYLFQWTSVSCCPMVWCVLVQKPFSFQHQTCKAKNLGWIPVDQVDLDACLWCENAPEIIFYCLYLTLKGLGGSPNSPNCQKAL